VEIDATTIVTLDTTVAIVAAVAVEIVDVAVMVAKIEKSSSLKMMSCYQLGAC
jgi:hypothetical protein